MKSTFRSRSSVAVSVVIPTFRRIEALRLAIGRILDCDPKPAEILIHVDAGDDETGVWLRSNYPDIRIIESEVRVGPGGGRNRLISEALHEIVAGFDDDSYPLREDHFRQIVRVFETFPTAGVVGCQIVHRGEVVPPPVETDPTWVASFVGCGCAYRRSTFLSTDGYVPLRVAYGMEEVDLALRLCEAQVGILRVPALPVFHDTDLGHHSRPDVTAHSIANVALLAFLRYPVRYWLLGLLQVISRVAWCGMHGRFRGLVSGIGMIPAYLVRHRAYRQAVSPNALLRFRMLTKRDRAAGST